MPKKKNSLMLKLCYGSIILVTTSACFLPLPVWLHMLTMTVAIIYIASHKSVPEDGEQIEGLEQLETKDAMMLPVFASGILLSLYLIFKFVKDIFAMVLKVYFLAFGIIILGNIVSDILSLFLPEGIVARLTAHSYHVPIPSFLQQKKKPTKEEPTKEEPTKEEPTKEEPTKEEPTKEEPTKEEPTKEEPTKEEPTKEIVKPQTPQKTEAEKQTWDFTNLNFIGYLLSSLVAVWCACNDYSKDEFWTDKWVVNNIFGTAFSIQWIGLFSMGSYFNACLLLGGLFFYDIFWVFGTDVMVAVAKNFDAPIKLLFPQKHQDRPSMLGLGDIVIPGAFIALMLRFDCHLAEKNKTKPESKFYFHTVLMFYIIGLAMTLIIMYKFEAAQPALLYLVPACLISSMGGALIRGDIKSLWEFKENEDETPAQSKTDTAQSTETDIDSNKKND